MNRGMQVIACAWTSALHVHNLNLKNWVVVVVVSIVFVVVVVVMVVGFVVDVVVVLFILLVVVVAVGVRIVELAALPNPSFHVKELGPRNGEDVSDEIARPPSALRFVCALAIAPRCYLEKRKMKNPM